MLLLFGGSLSASPASMLRDAMTAVPAWKTTPKTFHSQCFMRKEVHR